MEMHFVTENLRLEQPLGLSRSTALVTGEVTLPGGLREETRVLAAEAIASTESAEAVADRVNVRGRVVFHVLYTQGDPSKVNAIEATADFTHPCELPGLQEPSARGASAQAEVQVRRVEARAAGGSLSLRAEVEAAVTASVRTPVEAITGVVGTNAAEALSTEKKALRTASQGSTEALLREELPLPEGLSIRETLFADAYPVVEAVTGGVGRIGLTGRVLLEAVHASTLPGRPVVTTRHSIPFAQSVELTGEDGEKLDGWARVKDVAAICQDDGEGNQTLRAEVLLTLEGRADMEDSITVLEDAYTTQGDNLQFKGKNVLCRTGGGRTEAAESGRTTLMVPDSAPPVRTVLAAFVHPQLGQWETKNGRTTVSGQLDATLLYMTDGSDAPVSVRLSEPFRMIFSADIPGEDALITLAATGTEAVPVTSDRVEVRYILHLSARGDAAQPIHLVTEGEFVPAAPETEDVVLYFTQPGDTLWDIARRYRLPVAGVKSLNPTLTAEPSPGQGVVVWRRMAGS